MHTNCLLLDGGLATELEFQGFDLNHKLWSARLLLDNPQAITAAHLAYLRAGAQCIISASYQASIVGFMALGLTEEESARAITLSTTAARNAIDRYCNEDKPSTTPLLAASIGPYGAWLADGSEYHGHYDAADATLVAYHQSRLQILCATQIDRLACETIPSLREARILNDLLQDSPIPAWVSFSCRDGEHLSDGSTIGEAVALFSDNSRVQAVGVNCTSPQYISSLIHHIREATDKAIVVYPNSGECFHASSKTWSGTANPEECAEAALRWRAEGASIIGGCCRMGPSHIEAIARALLRQPQSP